MYFQLSSLDVNQNAQQPKYNKNMTRTNITKRCDLCISPIICQLTLVKYTLIIGNTLFGIVKENFERF